MNRLFASLAGIVMIAALAGCASNGYGGVSKVDTTAHTVTLYSGNTYTFDPAVDLSKVKVGDVVKVTYTVDGKKNVATAISNYQG